MKNLNLQDKKVAVLGMGMEGLALVDFLINKECALSALDKLSAEEIDKRLNEEEQIIFKNVLGNEKIVKIFGDNYLDNLSGFDIIFRSPGISFNNQKIQEVKNKGVIISSQIKLFFDLCPSKIIGVTGTKGKGTTASLIYEILKKDSRSVYLAGNIGHPAISLVPKLTSDDIVILELSSFQLMDLENSPQIAVVTNLLVDHLDYHENEGEYRRSKESIVKYQGQNDFAVLNKKSTFDQGVLSELKSSIKYFGSQEDIEVNVTENSVILDPQNRNIKICDKENIELFGHHNLENIAAATIVSDILGIDVEATKEVVKNFKGLPHRIEFVIEINGVKFINDSFATNPEPTMAAIDSFSEDKILILGGSSKGADFTKLAKKISSSNIKAVILMGDEADKIKQALITASYSGHINKGLSNIEEIVKAAREEASTGDVIILSPACASFGLFNNYKDRGEKFKTAVLNLNY